jgi:dihydropteroate synthase
MTAAAMLPARGPRVIGIVKITEDSFSDGVHVLHYNGHGPSPDAPSDASSE